VADTSPDDSTDTGVSLEAFNRLKAENDKMTVDLATANAAVTDLGLVDLARKHFADKGVADGQVDWMAHKALPDMRGKEDWKEAVDQEWSRLYPTEGNGQDKPAETQVPTPDAATPPAFARPDPSASGDPVGPTKIRPTIQTEAGRKFLNLPRVEQEAMDKAGEVVWSFEEPA
jgi:hypothetical protein